VVLALAAVGSSARGMRLALAASGSLGGLFGASLLAGADPGGALALAPLVTVGGLVIGGALGILRFESEVFDERAAQLERERDERARIAVAEERTRIARELHDVIGHSISVMGSRPERCAPSFATTNNGKGRHCLQSSALAAKR
jgi:signal transduction histidine kinase